MTSAIDNTNVTTEQLEGLLAKTLRGRENATEEVLDDSVSTAAAVALGISITTYLQYWQVLGLRASIPANTTTSRAMCLMPDGKLNPLCGFDRTSGLFWLASGLSLTAILTEMTFARDKHKLVRMINSVLKRLMVGISLILSLVLCLEVIDQTSYLYAPDTADHLILRVVYNYNTNYGVAMLVTIGVVSFVAWLITSRDTIRSMTGRVKSGARLSTRA